MTEADEKSSKGRKLRRKAPKTVFNNKQNSTINNYHKKLANLFRYFRNNELKSLVNSDNGKSSNNENSEIVEKGQGKSKSKYTDYEIAPVGVDLIHLEYRLSSFEVLKQSLTRSKSLMNGSIRISARVEHGPRLAVNFNATTLLDTKRYLPLSLQEYYENFLLVEKHIQKAFLPDFSIWLCEISKIEVFKVMQATHAPLDYQESLRRLDVKSKYMKGMHFESESGRTFSLLNGQEEVIFYDKTAELTKKLRKKKLVFQNMPDRMMRVEWKFIKDRSHIEKLEVMNCIDLLLKYDSIVGKYHDYFEKLLPEIELKEDKGTFGSVEYFESLFRVKGQKRSKGLNRMAKDAALARYLEENDHIVNFLRAKKGNLQQNKKINESITSFIAHLPGNKTATYFDLYMELKKALLSDTEIKPRVSKPE